MLSMVHLCYLLCNAKLAAILTQLKFGHALRPLAHCLLPAGTDLKCPIFSLGKTRLEILWLLCDQRLQELDKRK